MRHYTILFYLSTLFGYSYSQTVAPGYYVTKSHDTLRVQIKMPKSIFGSVDLSKFLFRVEVQDSISGIKKIKPEEIKSFGFIYNNESYRFFSKPTVTENNLRFIQPVILGQKTSLYQMQTVDQNGASLGTFYTFEKADGSYAFLNTGIKSLSKFRDTLKEFYKDNADLQQLIERKFQTRMSIKTDIIEIVRTANKKHGG